MSDPRYIKMDFEHCLGHVVEECGEVLAAAGKILRWGWEATNPELPIEKRESNLVWFQRELNDLKGAIDRLEQVIESGDLP